jgi:type II secretory pathway component PulF
MPRFLYDAIDADGETTAGEITSASVSAAAAELEAQGLVVVSIRQLPGGPAEDAAAQAAPVDEAGDVAEAFAETIRSRRATEVDALLVHRDEIAAALGAYAAELPRSRQRAELKRLLAALASGRREAVLAETSGVAQMCLALFSQGAQAGEPLRYLPKLFADAAQSNRFRNQWVTAWAYPLAIALLLAAVVVFLCVAVVPVIDGIYQGFGMQLPTATEAVIALSRAIRFHGGWLLTYLATGFAIGWGLLRIMKAFATTRGLLAWVTAGKGTQVAAAGSLARRLAELIGSGATPSTSLGVVAADSGWAFSDGATTLATELQPKSAAQDLAVRDAHFPWLRSHSRLPASVIHALAAPLESEASRAALLGELAQIYSDRVEDRFNWTSGMAGVIAIVLLGFSVGFFVIALFGPLVSLTNGLM